LAIAPAFAEAHHTLGILARRKAEFAEAFEHFSKAVELVPEAQSYRLDLADALLKLNQWEEASKVLATSLEADPSFVPSLFLLGDVCVRQGDYQKAIEILERAVALAPDFAKPYHPLATAYARLGDSAKAAQCVARFRALQSKTDQWYREELKALDDITRVRFQVADIYTAASHVRLLFDDPQAALEYLQRAVELSPDSVESGQTLAWLHERQGRPEEALRTLCDLRDRVPDNLTVHVSLGSLCTRMGRFDEAEQAYRKAIALTPQRAEPYAALIDLCLKSNRKLPEAKLLSLKVVALSPVARHYFLLSTVCGRTGDVTGARSALEHALALDPENDRLKQAWQGLTPRAGK
jgi:Flp pilus assembly protein TadD